MRKIIAATLVATSMAVAQFAGATSVGAAGAKVSFSVKGAQPNSALIFIGSNVALKVPATAKSATLSKKFYNTKRGRYLFSVHLVRADGRYDGPVVFKTNKKSWTVNVVTRGATSLGKFTVKTGGWSKSSKVLGTGAFGKTLRSPSRDGKPKGAGRIGVVKSSIGASAVRATAGVACGTDDQTLGTDCDGDGVPNAVDADDNNNGVLDIADAKTSGFESQKSLPWSTLYLEIGGPEKNLNANLANVTSDDIDAVMSNAFTIAFFLNLPPGEAQGYDAVWVDCGALSYCAQDSGSATTGPPDGNVGRAWDELWCSVALNSAGGCPEPILWRQYTGTTVDASGKATKVDVKGTAIWNALTRFHLNGGTVWSGGAAPRVSSGLMTTVKVGDPYVIRMRSASTGDITMRPAALGAFFVTVPVVATATVGGVTTTVDYSVAKPYGSNQDPIILGDDGLFTISFYRPQRSAIDGSDPAGSTFMDMGSLRYGLILNSEGGDRSALTPVGQSREVGCTSADGKSYDSIPTDFRRTPDNKGNEEYNGNVWPLTDTSKDATPDQSRLISITFNMKKCIAELKAAPTSRRSTVNLANTSLVPIQLTAVGIDLEGGASRAAQTFYVRLPAAATSW